MPKDKGSSQLSGKVNPFFQNKLKTAKSTKKNNKNRQFSIFTERQKRGIISLRPTQAIVCVGSIRCSTTARFVCGISIS